MTFPIYYDINDYDVKVGDFVMYQEQYDNSEIVYQITNYDQESGTLEMSEISDTSGPSATWKTNPDKDPVYETLLLKVQAI